MYVCMYKYIHTDSSYMCTHAHTYTHRLLVYTQQCVIRTYTSQNASDHSSNVFKRIKKQMITHQT